MNPPNINDIINNKKRFNYFEVSSDEIMNELKIYVINKINEMNIKLKGRELKKWITDFNNDIDILIKSFDTDKTLLKLFKNNMNELIALKLQLSMFIEIMSEIKTKVNKDFNLKKYLNSYKKELTNHEQPNKKIKVEKNTEDDDDEIDDGNIVDDDIDDDNIEDEDDYIDNDGIDDGNDDDDIIYENKFKNRQHKELVEELNKTKKVDNNNIIYSHFSKLNNREKNSTLKNLKEINNHQLSDIPSLFKIITLDLPLSQKNYILKKYLSLLSSHSDNNKLKTWIDAVLTLPIGKYTSLNFKSTNHNQIKLFLDNLEKIMDNAVWGHDDAKRQIIQIIGQQIRNPHSKGNMIGIWGPPGNGKCFEWDTPILMYDGTIKPVQDIIIGDIVMGDDSTPRNVLSLGSGIDKMYEITSNKGDSYIVNSEHILCLKLVGYNKIVKLKNDQQDYHYSVNYISNDSTYNIIEDNKLFETYDQAKEFYNSIDNIVEITVKNYLKLSYYIKSKLRGYKTKVNFPNKKTTFVPYTVGLCYGNEFNKELISLSLVNEYNYTLERYVLSDYLINCRNTRLELLAGIIDINGFYNETSKKIELTFESKNISDNIVFLARSLGFNAYQYKIKQNTYIYKINTIEKQIYRIEIYGNDITDIPTLCVKLENNNFKNTLLNKIQVTKKYEGNYYGFTLDGNNRFVLGDFHVTHNTTLIKEGISKALDKPFVFISLGGASDSSFLEGHSYTYEGSIYGRIAAGLIASKCMDPIFYFDELDKISNTHKGQEITNLLIHLTDPVQNSHFRDKYFNNIDLDLSRATFIFSYNDPCLVDRVLLDRITQIQTKYLLPKQKIHIAQNYLIPEMLKEMGLDKLGYYKGKNRPITIDDSTIHNIIENYTREGGVRKLKSILINIIRELNLSNLTKYKINDKVITFPYKINDNDIKFLLKNKNEIEYDKIHKQDKIGVINGLYASTLGIGGVLPIETMWIPASQPLLIKATGSLEKVITESTQVACSLAWNYLDKEIQKKYLTDWKDYPSGFHIHCPDGSTPKDGPSAGCALSIVIYSMLINKKIKHDIAITGEINLQGNVTAIGGLEEKLEGAKKAGVCLVLYPKENNKDIIRIKERNPLLIDDNFKVQSIETLEEAISYALI